MHDHPPMTEHQRDTAKDLFREVSEYLERQGACRHNVVLTLATMLGGALACLPAEEHAEMRTDAQKAVDTEYTKARQEIAERAAEAAPRRFDA